MHDMALIWDHLQSATPPDCRRRWCCFQLIMIMELLPLKLGRPWSGVSCAKHFGGVVFSLSSGWDSRCCNTKPRQRHCKAPLIAYIVCMSISISIYAYACAEVVNFKAQNIWTLHRVFFSNGWYEKSRNCFWSFKFYGNICNFSNEALWILIRRNNTKNSWINLEFLGFVT